MARMIPLYSLSSHAEIERHARMVFVFEIEGQGNRYFTGRRGAGTYKALRPAEGITYSATSGAPGAEARVALFMVRSKGWVTGWEG